MFNATFINNSGKTYNIITTTKAPEIDVSLHTCFKSENKCAARCYMC